MKKLSEIARSNNPYFQLACSRYLPMGANVEEITSSEARTVFEECEKADESSDRFILIGVNRYWNETPSPEGGFENGFSVFQAADGTIATSVRHARNRFPTMEETVWDFQRALASQSTRWYRIKR